MLRLEHRTRNTDMCTQILICQLIKRKSFCVNEKEKQWVRSVVARLLVGRDQGMAADLESPKGNESVIFHLIWDHFPSQDLQGVIVSPHMKSLTLYKQFKLIILARGLMIRWCSWSDITVTCGGEALFSSDYVQTASMTLFPFLFGLQVSTGALESAQTNNELRC